LQRAIDEAARAQVPLALPPGVYRTGMLRLQAARNWSACAARPNSSSAAAHRCCRAKAPPASAYRHHLRRRRHSAADAARPGALHRRPRHPHRRLRNHASGGNGIWLEQVSGDISGNIFTKIATAVVVVRRAGPDRLAQHHLGTNDNGIEILRTRSATTARSVSTTASRTSRPAPAAPGSMATPSTPSAPAT
jgi:hypothetical protein